VLVQEGDQPTESPESLMAELNGAIEQLESLVRRINATNILAKLPDGISVADAVVRRDMIRLRREAMEQAAEAASMRGNRFTRNEVKFVLTVQIAELHNQVDRLSKAWRELDAQIQAVNWTNELVS